MKIEKINENRIQITFNHTDLKENNIDLHSFMSNSIESQSLFLLMLDKAEHEVGFITDNYKLSIQAMALSNGTFVITVTRIEKEILKSTRVQAHRKTAVIENNTLIYRFTNFDDFCNFTNFLSVSLTDLTEHLTGVQALYQYKDCFFFILQNMEQPYFSTLSTVITEFGEAVDNPDLMLYKIKEYGKLVTNQAIHSK